MSKWIFLIFVCMVYLQTCSGDIPDYQDFGPIRRPANPLTARDILGYDSFQTVRSSKEVRYGNDWERYDAESRGAPRYEPDQGRRGRNQRYNDRDYDYRDPYRRY